MRAPKASALLAVIALVITACGGTTYVQPEMPTAEASAALLPLRALSLSFDRGIASVDAGGQMRFGDVIVGTFAESGTFTVEGGSVWATMDERGAIRVTVDDPAQAGPSEVTFRVTEDRLFQPDGSVLATIDASGQLVTSTGSFPITGITSRARRLALFLYLVAATYAEDVPAAGTGETH